ncbi:HPF/RaiA family ribosome-associated protein [Spongiimicrobium salis]|uniref:HPF/RaiA family ribosome-associated protein n=1 Tax=Spongiimicrobium salis TaxID=1667022 RepID=UPI00374D7E73
MTVEIQYVRMKTSESLNGIVRAKLEKLNKRYQWLIRAKVRFKQANDSEGLGKICEIELSAPGPRLFAMTTSDNFEKALVGTLDGLEQQLRKRKEVFQRKS